MKALNGLPLDDDIVDRILIFSPDFTSLKNTILTAKAFHSVFKLHPKSIIRAVAYNVVGPALPQALRAIRYRIPAQDDADEQPEGEFDDSWEAEIGEHGSILPVEVVQLVENARAFRSLEEVFSLRHKDRRYNASSQLSFIESWRFQRTMYRIMLYSRIFDGPRYVEMIEEFDDEDEDGENKDLVDRLAKERRRRRKFLDDFSDEQLLQVHSVSRFLREVFLWAGHHDFADQEILGDSALSVGPTAIYECFESKCRGPVEDALEYWDIHDGGNALVFISGYLSYPLTQIFEERKLKLPLEDSSHWKSILDSVEGEMDTCARCNVVKGFDLLGPSTFDYLSAKHPDFAFMRLPLLMKGHLGFSQVERPYFDSLIRTIPSNGTLYEYVIQAILGSNYKQPEFADLKPDDWLCMDCVKKVLEENLHLWLLDKRIQAGDNVPTEDCWYGWNCRTQTHKQSHAARLNHICPQTKS
ncbi:hypothetical protein E1B28_005509 [Marasmius oreades]|uniref:Aprataxin and PNK-like factor PBZ domain-containing protein n=1 Tax=Marasmius oreades TaxID=181124 RepID=A0A9P7S3Z9_9AGAR|nr:uncharacterized protein E1B28_005509 [Marasmius oreades]KAG7094690.1 hypothetical protein E1B28_005509 [Marasmius oreades]